MKFFAIFIFLIIICAIFSFVTPLRNYVLNLSFEIKNFYDSKRQGISTLIDDYKNQAQTIEQMRERIQNLEAQNLKYMASQAEFDNLYYSLNIEKHYEDSDVSLVKVVSFAALGLYTQFWIDYAKEADSKKVYGLIKDGYAIGIAKWSNNHLLGILNGDAECSYSVYIGENRAIGMLRTLEGGGVIVDYIHAWQSVKNGDFVKTSGLDGIFFEGVQVGILGNVKYENGYLRAEITPYNYSHRLSYVWLVDTKIKQTINLYEKNVDDGEE